MPRHRRERVPRHRAQRQTVNSARRARVSAALASAGSVSEPSSPDTATETTATLQLPAFRVIGAGMVSGAMRGLMVTPWFAAATGFVVAAGLWIYSPHAELKFPPSAVGVVPCATQGCGAASGHGVGTPATTKGQRIAPPKSTRMSAAQAELNGGTTAPRLTFGYRVLWQSDGKFGVLITLTGKRVPRTWKLTFALPGDTIIGVVGATWHASGGYGGTASWPVTSPGQPGVPGADQTNGDAPYGTLQPGSAIMIVGEGTPVVPTGCIFNGASCKFS